MTHDVRHGLANRECEHTLLPRCKANVVDVAFETYARRTKYTACALDLACKTRSTIPRERLAELAERVARDRLHVANLRCSTRHVAVRKLRGELGF